MDTGYEIQAKQRMIQDMRYNLKKGYEYRIWDTIIINDIFSFFHLRNQEEQRVFELPPRE